MNHERLPIQAVRKEILEKIKNNQFVIIEGSTGSGKSTTVPILVYNDYLKDGEKVVITQPRRVAAISLCRYVSKLMESEVGGKVGFSVRFMNKTSDKTRIKYVTDGILMREATTDPTLSKYSVIVIDEVHERSIRSDILLGIIKLALPKRPDLKVIIMSATIESNMFSDFFTNSAVIKVPGKHFPVEIYYTPNPFEDYIEAAMLAVFKINLTTSEGDILVFLPGQEDIELLEKLIKEKISQLQESMGPVKKRKKLCVKLGDNKYKMNKWKGLDIVPLYSALSIDKQYLVFRKTPQNSRKVVLATNIAETSLTIPGITYVVDTGLVKQRKYNPKHNLESLTLTITSKASAKQRAGRAGREGPGKIYRLYTRESYEEMPEFTTPEIHLVDFSFIFLELKMIGVKDIVEFPFMDPPEKNTILSAALNLYRLGALDSEGNLTKTGKLMAKIPLLPLHSKLLITSFEFGCTSEILTIVSMLSITKPTEKYNPEGVKLRSNLYNKHGDHLTLLNLYDLWENANSGEKFSKEFAINNHSLLRALDIRNQLVSLVTSEPFNIKNITKCKDASEWDQVRMCLAKGTWTHAARFAQDSKSYKTLVNNQTVYIHPTSVLFNKKPLPSHVVFNDCILTKKNYIQNITEISEQWLTTYVPNWFKEKS
ncbi:ATP-dependent helicase [Theileria orientalis]|uniref:RNA helicase n=1 Tax=Theileria orientalis TaxID=68886 RepID=A0A976MD75_THEOR|nr:ATP-dependent helicase [Theileria orientalis]